MKIELDEKDWKLLEKHLRIYIEKNYEKLDRSAFNTRAYRKEYLHFVNMYNQILEQHYASKIKELKE
jgi:hypothetical protein